jgi:hypothetical protein
VVFLVHSSENTAPSPLWSVLVLGTVSSLLGHVEDAT